MDTGPLFTTSSNLRTWEPTGTVTERQNTILRWLESEHPEGGIFAHNGKPAWVFRQSNAPGVTISEVADDGSVQLFFLPADAFQ